MGTRADFYVGRGKEAEWLGSIAWDGYPDAMDKAILRAKDEKVFRSAVDTFLKAREDATFPKDGWPWPWDDSQTTDYAYAFNDGKVYGSNFGHKWFSCYPLREPEESGNAREEFPDMKSKKAVTFGKRSGLLIIGGVR